MSHFSVYYHNETIVTVAVHSLLLKIKLIDLLNF